VPETVLGDLSIVARNGHANDKHERVAPPRGLKGAKPKKTTGLEPGRRVDPTLYRYGTSAVDMGGNFGYGRRPYGRDEETLRALKTIRDLDPQASQAVSTFLRLINPGHDLQAFVFKDPNKPFNDNSDPTGSEIKENGEAQAFLDELARRVGTEYGFGLDQLHNVLSLSLITNGAVAAEVAPTDDLTDVVDWFPVDPMLVHFRRDDDHNLILGQIFRDGSFHPLNTEQVFYMPLDPDVNDPYGRPPLLPAINIVLQRASLINDIRAVAHAQGFPRLNVTVRVEPLIASMPPLLNEAGRESDRKEWMESILDSVVSSYDSLEVDDVFVHYDWVEISVIGPVHSNSGFDFKGIEQVLSKNLNSALKMLPILLGINEATSETHGSIQWQIQIETVKALRNLVKRVIERCANVSLQMKGFQAHARVTYKDTRTTDRLFEEQANFFQTRTVQLQEQMGYRSHDEAAEILTGHAAAGEAQLLIPTPQPNTSTNTGGDTSTKAGDKAAPPAKPDAGPDQPKAKANNPGSWAAWELALQDDPRVAVPSRYVDSGDAGRETRNQKQLLTRDHIDTRVESYVEVARRIFEAAQRDLVAQLAIEGYDIDGYSGRFVAKRDQAKDIADYVFGVGFSREMKALLRDAFREGMAIAGHSGEEIDSRLIERVWRENRQYIEKIRDELKSALRAGEFSTITDIHRWFELREWRELLMGRFLAKQGLESGHAYATTKENGINSLFTWEISPGAEHCSDCNAREGNSYSYDELTSIGFPGSGSLDCAANCKCSLSPE
jgi:hypothetical protein